MSKAGTAITLPLETVQLSCGCTQSYRVAPPMAGDEVLCITHDAVIVEGRIGGSKRNASDPRTLKRRRRT